MKSSKSPLKGKPLRNPGESTDIALREYFWDKFFPYLLATFMFGYIALMDWYRYMTDSPVMPWHFTIVFITALALTSYKFLKIKPIIRNMKLGRDGEKTVGQFLESLRESGAKVFHDIPGDNFNLDHIVITTAGIFLIETKTYSKPARGEPTITFDGQSVTLRERGSFEAPVIQVKAGSVWLRELLKTSTGRDFPIRPVLAFPGWFVQPTAEAKKSRIWVLNPKALPAFISNSSACISSDDVHLAAYHLSRYIRTYEEGRGSFGY
ncbi:MAG: nuclease-related domain-containing protein [Pseudomonadales bacterium]